MSLQLNSNICETNFSNSHQTSYETNYFTPIQAKRRESWCTNSKIHLTQPHTILWTVKVLSDGWGDLFNCLNAFRLTRQEYPEWNMRIFASISKGDIPFNIEEYKVLPEELLVIPRHGTNGGQSIEKEIFFAKTAAYGKNSSSGKSKNEQLFTKLPVLANKIDDFLNFSEIADLEIAVSADPEHCFKKREALKTQYIHFEEYGGTGTYHVQLDHALIMGVKPSSCGIFIFQFDVPTKFSNELLHQYFTSSDNNYFNYGWDIQGYTSLINRLNSNAKEINIFTNASFETIQKIDTENNQNIVFVNKKGVETEIFSPTNSERTLRFINPFPLEHADIILAIKMSQEPVGITGNNTFSEILSLDKLLFYNNRAVLQPFWEGLIYLAKHATPLHIQLISYLEQMSVRLASRWEQNGSSLRFLQDYEENSNVNIQAQDLPILREQWTDLVTILRRDWDVKAAFLGEINHRILLKQGKI